MRCRSIKQTGSVGKKIIPPATPKLRGHVLITGKKIIRTAIPLPRDYVLITGKKIIRTAIPLPRDYVLITGKKIIRPDSKTLRRFLRNLLATIGIIRTATYARCRFISHVLINKRKIIPPAFFQNATGGIIRSTTYASFQSRKL